MNKGQCIGRGRTADVYEWGNCEVLKLFKVGYYNEGEAKNTSIINSLGIPSPKVVGIVDIGSQKGIIYERINGITMSQSIDEASLSLSIHAGIMAELHTLIHSKRVNIKPNLKQELSKMIKGNLKLSHKQKSFILVYLDRLEDDFTVCHYDFHPDNIIMSPNGPIVIDWANALIGNPLADVARTSLILRSTALPPEPVPNWISKREIRIKFHNLYLEEYSKLNNLNPYDLEQWELPSAAVRLGENITEEEQLLSLIIDNQINL